MDSEAARRRAIVEARFDALKNDPEYVESARQVAELIVGILDKHMPADADPSNVLLKWKKEIQEKQPKDPIEVLDFLMSGGSQDLFIAVDLIQGGGTGDQKKAFESERGISPDKLFAVMNEIQGLPEVSAFTKKYGPIGGI